MDDFFPPWSRTDVENNRDGLGSGKRHRLCQTLLIRENGERGGDVWGSFILLIEHFCAKNFHQVEKTLFRQKKSCFT